MGKKIHNPPPPTGMVRPTPPPNPPRVPCWQDDIDEVKRLTAALEQAQQLQRVTADTVTQQDELLNMYSERIEQLEALANDAEDILSQGAGQLDHDIHEWRRQYRGLLLAGESDEAVAVGPNATGANALIVPDQGNDDG